MYPVAAVTTYIGQATSTYCVTVVLQDGLFVSTNIFLLWPHQASLHVFMVPVNSFITKLALECIYGYTRAHTGGLWGHVGLDDNASLSFSHQFLPLFTSVYASVLIDYGAFRSKWLMAYWNYQPYLHQQTTTQFLSHELLRLRWCLDGVQVFRVFWLWVCQQTKEFNIKQQLPIWSLGKWPALNGGTSTALWIIPTSFHDINPKTWTDTYHTSNTFINLYGYITLWALQ